MQELISTPSNIMVENIIAGPVRVAGSGVKSCQTNRKEGNMFCRDHHGDSVSPDIHLRQVTFAVGVLSVVQFEEAPIVRGQKYE